MKHKLKSALGIHRAGRIYCRQITLSEIAPFLPAARVDEIFLKP